MPLKTPPLTIYLIINMATLHSNSNIWSLRGDIVAWINWGILATNRVKVALFSKFIESTLEIVTIEDPYSCLG